jgi:UDP-glucuronate 4-epimerase
MKRVLITGAAGFIGSSLTDVLLNRGSYQIIGLDNFDDFYEREIKISNLKYAFLYKNFSFYDLDLRNKESLNELLQKINPEIVIHLAAKAGVRPSILDPQGYFDVNVHGTLNILEAMRMSDIKKLIFASSSSVYGNCKIAPFSEEMNVDNPISPYAASKKAGELLCHTYHHLHAMDIFCLRFFTVYGPRQRPDLAIHKFTKALLNGDEIPFYGDGSTRRDYTHINDIIHGIEKAIENLQGHEIFNLGESHTTSLEELVASLERATGKKAIKKMLPLQDGDVFQTYADISKAKNILGYMPSTDFNEGILDFVQWYKARIDG